MKRKSANSSEVSVTILDQSPANLHRTFWNKCGIQVVTPGTACQFERGTKIFLLTNPNTLVLFDPRQAINRFCWIMPRVLCIRLHAKDMPAFSSRLGLTSERELAESWNRCRDTKTLWRTWKREIPQIRRAAMSLPGRICLQQSDSELATFMQRLTAAWHHPEVRIAVHQDAIHEVIGNHRE